MQINLTKKELIEELKWCLDMIYPLEYKGKIINARLSKENIEIMANAIVDLLSVHFKKGGVKCTN